MSEARRDKWRAVVAALVSLSVISLVGVVSVTALSSSSAASSATASPPDQLVVVTVNAEQYYTYDPARLTTLAAALSARPVGADGSHYAPDIIIADEVTAQTINELRGDLNTDFGSNVYQVYGDQSFGHGSVGFLVNTQTMNAGRYQTWVDPCYSGRVYQWLNVTETASNLGITIAGLHLDPNTTESCREQNINKLRSQVAQGGTQGSVVGDFNKRPVTLERECDPNETSTPLQWYTDMTSYSSTDNRAYMDTVRTYDRTFAISMADEWTHENANPSTLCNGVDSYKRSRIDYVFVSTKASLMEAHADNPGWANASTPGSVNPTCSTDPTYCRYSDHRFVWARVDLSGLAGPIPPTTSATPSVSPSPTPSSSASPTSAASPTTSPTASPSPSPSPTTAPPAVSTTTCPNGTTHTSYTCALQATGGKSPYTWNLSAGKLPQGTSLSSTGTISGKPTKAGTYSFTVRVTDSSSPSQSATRNLTIAISK